MSPKVSQTGDLDAWVEQVLPTDLGVIRPSERDLLKRLRHFGYDEDQLFAVRLAFEEAMVNAMKHGNEMDPARHVRLRYRVSADRAEIRIADEGAGFNPGVIPDPTADENLNKPCGRGIMLMRCYMDEVTYSANGREVTMVKYRRSGDAQTD